MVKLDIATPHAYAALQPSPMVVKMDAATTIFWGDSDFGYSASASSPSSSCSAQPSPSSSPTITALREENDLKLAQVLSPIAKASISEEKAKSTDPVTRSSPQKSMSNALILHRRKFVRRNLFRRLAPVAAYTANRRIVVLPSRPKRLLSGAIRSMVTTLDDASRGNTVRWTGVPSFSPVRPSKRRRRFF